MLNKFQCTPDVAQNGQEALNKIAANHYDLVFMDCQMPVMDGYEAVRILRGQELTHALRRVPVVALTAHAAPEERDKCLAVGMDEFLTKPVTRQNLAKVLAYWLDAPDAEVATLPLDGTQPITPSPSCWDEALVLRQLDNDQEFLYGIMQTFIEETPAKLRELSNTQDLETMFEIAHGLVSVAGTFSAMPLKACAQELERNARHNKLADYQLLIQNVVNAVNVLIVAFNERLEKVTVIA